MTVTYTAGNGGTTALPSFIDIGNVVFPQELFDNIIDHLYDDKDTLKRCSLVCKAWIPTTSLHLFPVLRWPSPRVHRIDCVWEDIESGCFGGCLHLLTLSNRIRPYVRELQLCTHQYADSEDHLGLFTETATIHLHVLLQILDLLPSLESLIFDGCMPLSEAPPADHQRVQTLQQLRFVLTRQLDLLGFLGVLASILRVSSLQIIASMSDDVSDGSQSFHHSPRLQQLTAVDTIEVSLQDEEQTISLFNSLESIVDLRCLPTLALTFMSCSSRLSAIFRLMPNLTSLRYMADPYNFPTTTHNLRLHFIHIGGSLFSASSPIFVLHWRAILRDLEILVSDATRQITIHLELISCHSSDGSLASYFGELLGRIDSSWTLLANVLRRCSVLERLRVEIAFNGLSSQKDQADCLAIFRAVVEERLPSDIVHDTLEVATTTDGTWILQNL